jgi:hypothetical protein
LYNFAIMLKYGAFFVLLLLVSAFVTSQHQQHSKDATAPSANSSHPTITASDAKQAKGDSEESEWYSPSGFFAYAVFGFPNGITVWALFLTMLVIAEQTRETAKSAKATERSVTITVNQMRPRLLLKLEDFKTIINGIPHVTLTVTNIGGSKAIFGLCLGGMKAAAMGKKPESLTDYLRPLAFTGSILNPSKATVSQIKVPQNVPILSLPPENVSYSELL